MAHLTLVMLLFAALTACGERESAPRRPAAESAAVDPAAGKSIAERHCFACHRADGSGAAPGIPQLAQQNAAYLVLAMEQYASGKRPHAVLKDMMPRLSEADLRNVAAYYASLSLPESALARPAERGRSPIERGKAAAAACAGCHGADGNSTIAGTPSLAGQQPVYLLAALAEYHRGNRGTPALGTMLRSADRLELESLALYYAAQTPKPQTLPAVGDAAVGEVFALRCSGCHGARGVSQDPTTPVLAGQDPQYLIKALSGYGKGRHHASMQRQFGALGDRDVRNLAAYFAAQKGHPSQPAQDLVAQQVDKCDRCHGDTAGLAAVPVPRIRGQDKDYLVMALRAYRDDRRESSTMHRMSLPVSEAAIDGVADHYAGQRPR